LLKLEVESYVIIVDICMGSEVSSQVETTNIA
jgi:hypothetical protein